MKPLLLLFFVLIICRDLPAQDSTLVTIKAGYKVTDVLTPADIYYYTQFTDGTVVLKDGTKVEAKMNYSRLYGQMLFIGPNSDTLAIGDEKNIKFISIGQDKFYYDEGFIRIIADNDFVKLAEKQVWVVADVRKMGTFNRPTNTVAIQSLTSYTNGSDAAKSKDLILNEELLLRRETQYYFGDAYNHFVRSGKKKLLSLFPKDEKDLEKYLNQNKVSFDKKEDLEKLVEFLNGLY
jgi:hypothetical protein